MESDTAQARSAPGMVLRRFAQPTPPVERCELCDEPLAQGHPHLVDPTDRKVICACRACAMLFCEDATTRFRRVRRDVRPLPDFDLSRARWDELGVPIGLAFFFHSSPAGQTVGIYPSPAGPTETVIEPGPWSRLIQGCAPLQNMRPDIEALLVYRAHDANRFYLAPIDTCYRLVGLIRTHWHGFTGGKEVWQEIERFFAELNQGRAR